MSTITQDLQDIFQTGVDSVKGDSVVSKELTASNYSEKFHVVAIGKAADSMLQGVENNKIISALLLSKHGHISVSSFQNPKFNCVESDHPVPKASSLQSGEILTSYLQALPEDEPCLFLISGGTSALVEVLNEGWNLEQLEELNRYLLANSYSINQINAVRREVSQIKGGRLWRFIKNREVHCLMISDVKGDNPADIGSGLLFDVNDNKLPDISEKWSSRIKKNYADKSQIKRSSNFQWKIIASLDIAKNAAAVKAKELGYNVKVSTNFLEGEALVAAKECVAKLREKPNTLFIRGGETVVNLPESAGKGGRNQHLALAAAIEMTELENSYLLAASTDGSDGETIATGAIVTNDTVNHGLSKKLKAVDYLKNADSNMFFTELDMLVETGPTGTNVMDLVIAIHNPK